MGQIIRYIDGAQACRVAQPEPDAWIMPTYRRWILLGLAVTVLLLGWAQSQGWW